MLRENKIYNPDSQFLQENIAKLAGINTGAQQKAELILVLAGLKPATDLSLYRNNDSSEKVLALLKECGLAAVVTGKNEKSETLSVAKDETDLERLLKASPASDHEEFGRLMGYPDTAIAAFNQPDQLLSEAEEQNLIADNPDIVLNFFKMSQAHWPQELACLRTWNDYIKQNAPDIYEELGGKIEPPL